MATDCQDNHDSLEMLGILLDRMTFVIEILKVSETSKPVPAAEIMNRDSILCMQAIITSLEKVMPTELESEIAVVIWNKSKLIWQHLLETCSCTKALRLVYVLWLCWACLIRVIEPDYRGFTEFHPDSLRLADSYPYRLPDRTPSEANLGAVLAMANEELERIRRH